MTLPDPEPSYGYLIEEGVGVRIASYGTYASRVVYTLGGTEFDVYVENEELIFSEDWNGN